MSKFRKKPVVIEAMQWDGSINSYNVIREWTDHVADVALAPNSFSFYVHTKEGDMRVSPGDWIIRGVKGEYYPCKPDIFEETYESVDPVIGGARYK